MPRPLRVEFVGAGYHIINRGNYRSPIFAGKRQRKDHERVAKPPTNESENTGMVLIRATSGKVLGFRRKFGSGRQDFYFPNGKYAGREVGNVTYSNGQTVFDVVESASVIAGNSKKLTSLANNLNRRKSVLQGVDIMKDKAEGHLHPDFVEPNIEGIGTRYVELAKQAGPWKVYTHLDFELTDGYENGDTHVTRIRFINTPVVDPLTGGNYYIDLRRAAERGEVTLQMRYWASMLNLER